MKTVIFSDLQLHNYKTYSSVDTDGVNDRLKDHMGVLDQIRNYCLENSITTLVSNGDDFDQRKQLEVTVIQPLLDWKIETSRLGITQLNCSGNHDKIDRSSNTTSLDLFKHVPKQKIYKTPEWYVFPDKTAILFVPFMNTVEAVLNGISLPVPEQVTSYIVLIHYGLTGIDMGGIVISDPENLTEGFITKEDLDFHMNEPRCKRILFGHIHVTIQVNEKIGFIGTTLQHNWGERNVNCRFLEVDIATGEMKSIPTIAPRFVDFHTPEEIEAEKCKGNFCRVTVDDVEKKDKFKSLLMSYGARAADVVVVKKVFKPDSKLNLNLGMSFTEMGKKMLSSDKENGLDVKKLEDIMEKALRSAIEA